MVKKRVIQRKIAQLMAMFPIVTVVGARQCGKSTLVQHLFADWDYYDLESPDDYRLISSDPGAFFSLHHQHVIIDEAQQYPELFRVLRGVIDRDRQQKGRFILTGSSSPAIVRGITESLAGRVATVEMAPFKQCEYYGSALPDLYTVLVSGGGMAEMMALRPVTSLAGALEVWFRGGFPEPLIAAEKDEGFYRQWMEHYMANYVNRDIRALFPRLDMFRFRQFLTLIAQSSGHQLNMSAMARAVETSVPTIKGYLDIIHHTFLWRNLHAYTGNALKKVQKADKGMFRDQGMLHYLLKIHGLDDLLLHPAAGASFESFVIEELIRGLEATMATQLAFRYYRTVDRAEVDLIIEGAFGVIPVEIKLASVVRPQSLRALKRFVADMDAPYGILINRGRRVERLGEKIIQIPVNYI